MISFSFISIHLMLRFIKITEVDSLLFNLFQYISCYGLSLPETTLSSLLQSFQYISCYGLSMGVTITKRNYISIHLMLRFITQKLQIAAADNKISIHPMLRFITVPRMMQHESPNFNTSHVTVYPINSL